MNEFHPEKTRKSAASKILLGFESGDDEVFPGGDGLVTGPGTDQGGGRGFFEDIEVRGKPKMGSG